MACAAAGNSADTTMDVKSGALFELTLPTYSKTVGKFYYWSPTFDSEYICSYTDMDNVNWCFKALKKGQKVIIMQLYEIDAKDNSSKLIKTVTYNIHIN